jgi:hypothetical protein
MKIYLLAIIVIAWCFSGTAQTRQPLENQNPQSKTSLRANPDSYREKRGNLFIMSCHAEFFIPASQN